MCPRQVKRILSSMAQNMARPSPSDPAPARRNRAPRSAETQAAALRRTRLEHAAETAQDYAEAIADLSVIHGEARAVDLARRLGVSHVTVIRTIARLQRDGYVSTRPYRSIFLTEKGLRVAEESRRRHEIVTAFLRSLGVPQEIAETDAEGIEHHVSPETLAAFKHWTASRH
jgi:DtxR family manganese transport transcriptional regulator